MSRPAGRWRRLTVVVVVVGAVLAHHALRRWVVAFTEMHSESMQPTLVGHRDGGDVVLLDLLGPRLRAPARGECVAFLDESGLSVIKRVAGLSGESISMVDGRLLIDGAPHGDPRLDRIRYYPRGNLAPGVRFEIATDRVFLLGDDTKDSYDSRYTGGVRLASVRGLARWIVWPPSRFGPVD